MSEARGLILSDSAVALRTWDLKSQLWEMGHRLLTGSPGLLLFRRNRSIPTSNIIGDSRAGRGVLGLGTEMSSMSNGRISFVRSSGIPRNLVWYPPFTATLSPRFANVTPSGRW